MLVWNFAFYSLYLMCMCVCTVQSTISIAFTKVLLYPVVHDQETSHQQSQLPCDQSDTRMKSG